MTEVTIVKSRQPKVIELLPHTEPLEYISTVKIPLPQTPLESPLTTRIRQLNKEIYAFARSIHATEAINSEDFQKERQNIMIWILTDPLFRNGPDDYKFRLEDYYEKAPKDEKSIAYRRDIEMKTYFPEVTDYHVSCMLEFFPEGEQPEYFKAFNALQDELMPIEKEPITGELEQSKLPTEPLPMAKDGIKSKINRFISSAKSKFTNFSSSFSSAS